MNYNNKIKNESISIKEYPIRNQRNMKKIYLPISNVWALYLKLIYIMGVFKKLEDEYSIEYSLK